jgi:hypothetical protein
MLPGGESLGQLPASTPRPAVGVTHHPIQWATEASMDKSVRIVNVNFHLDVGLIPRLGMRNIIPPLPHIPSWRQLKQFWPLKIEQISCVPKCR